MTTALPTQERVDEIARELAPDVVRIRFRKGFDWTNDPALYFNVVLSDNASRVPYLFEVTKRVKHRFEGEFGLNELDPNSFFSFRSESENAALKDQSWV